MLSEETASSRNDHSRIFPAYSHLNAALIAIFQFLLACSGFLLWEEHIILKFNIMKSYQFKNSSKKETEKTTLWEAFTNHLDSIYFPGAAEALDKKLVAFEYEAFKECYV